MAQHRSHGRRAGAKRLPGWVWLLLGLTLGMASVLLTQLVVKRAGSHDGLAGLFATKVKPVEPATATRPEPAPPKPKLDFYTVLPEIETVLPDRNPRARTSKPERAETGARYVLQVGSFASFEEADQLKAKLALQGMQAQIQRVAIEGKGEYHRVRLGPYQSLDALDAVNQRLSKLGIKALRLKLKGAAG